MKVSHVSTLAAYAGFRAKSVHPYWQDVNPCRAAKSPKQQERETVRFLQDQEAMRKRLAGKRILPAIA